MKRIFKIVATHALVFTLGYYAAEQTTVTKIGMSCIEELHSRQARQDIGGWIFEIIEFRKEPKGA